MAEGARRRRLSGIRVAQLLLVLAAAGLYTASRLTWVEVESFDGLGPPKTIALAGSTWSTALVPVALLLGAAVLATLAVRGWPLRALALLLAVVSAAIGYLAISQWVLPDVALRATELAEVSLLTLVGSERHYGGAVVTLCAGVATLVAAALLMRAASQESAQRRYTTPGARRAALREQAEAPAEAASPAPTAEPISERTMWDALDEGQDPTDGTSGPETGGPSEGR
ncbi:TIGR02234 family membrane protein [[Mycobacterium] wendilense]|uniref:TIGR02234 family membrane protein n=1 Tax=[Mycobacterium] wendilense TaxID=3064284 RepID=A0ABN9P1F2_9MYCO|nr:TIGR02234 family membrane protein [Mycolicibacterium sp. MU0050]CAJ1583115.1 TIGR02234 family membrane protein [Mycolicibacterium sp. MU0050]